ncbi:5'/3'-nucleotidase SurE [Thermodesulfovibrionales bacterium]|nr:5'/3'-nucleotidase SurE [Thermodesulfovibrionales bacterium]MCL0074678.1 5'/3'-nucleotidase SurE [Thermodesulfovibrionales bacterium]
MTPLILVTNDDGVHSPGIIALFEDMKKVGNAYIVAPDRERSAVSHALTLHRPLKADELRENVFSVNGTPTDCVVLAIHRILSKKPDIVVSGINMGANLGDDITYSGTVSAAIEGTILNVPSFAISLAGDKPFHYETAAAFATEIAKYILSRSLPYDTLLNVNVPDMAKNEIKGIKITKQGKRIYDNAIRDIYSPRGDKYYWIGGGELYWERGEDMDSHAVQNSYVSVTPIHLDMTNYEALSDLIKHPI